MCFLVRLIMSMMVPLPVAESKNVIQETKVSIPIDDQAENERKEDEKFLAELRVISGLQRRIETFILSR